MVRSKRPKTLGLCEQIEIRESWFRSGHGEIERERGSMRFGFSKNKRKEKKKETFRA